MTRTTHNALVLLALAVLGCDRAEIPLAPAVPATPAFVDGPVVVNDGTPLPAPTASPVHVLHTDFVSVQPTDQFINGVTIKGTPIAFAADYFYAAGTFGQADGIVTLTLPTGGTVTAVRAYVYGDGTGTTGGTVRIADVVLWRVGDGSCPTLGDQRSYCPYGWVNVTTGVDALGWSTKTHTVSQLIAAGFTYKVIVNLRNTTVVDQKLRLGWVEVEYTDPPSASSVATAAAVVTRPTLTVADRALLNRATTSLRRVGLAR